MFTALKTRLSGSTLTIIRVHFSYSGFGFCFIETV